MTRVAISACSTVPFTAGAMPVGPLLLESAARLFESGADRDAVDAVLVSTNDNSKYLAPILAEAAGIRAGAAHTVESLCSSGASAIASAYSYVASGLAESVLVCGAESAGSPGAVLEWDRARGAHRHPVYWASILASAYRREYSASDEQLAAVPAKNRRHARGNPAALPGPECTIRDVMESRQVTDDVRLLECSRACSGAAALLVTSEEAAGPDPVWITGIGQSSRRASFAGGARYGELESTREAGAAAMRMAGRRPADMDVAEVHDAFAVCEPMALEALGMCAPGRGAEEAARMYDSGDNSINPRGGLLGAGHPLGATGIAQAAEIVQQLRGRAGSRQVGGAQTGLVHNMSAAGTSSSVLVVER